ncbi:predicted protein [Lichtheimia corymbifera JMRC:FSU:9682]|uniref:Uncharacterized protein n=1 Tax=Lichtheimia corymbifera JMRC:FSU:9682 TaxID=1263082 RepID=A0A068SHH4_9FUNG|nr:predicted protein [Lichtheimia corymbifera JMRC:FSU:9682]
MPAHQRTHPGLVDAMATNSWKLPFAGRELDILKDIIGVVGWDVNDIKQQLRQRRVWKHNNIIHTALSTLCTRQQQQQQQSSSSTPTTNDTSNVNSANSTPYNTPRLEPFRDLQQPPSPSSHIIGFKRTMADRSPQPDYQGRSRRSTTTSSSSTTRSQPRHHRILSNTEEDDHITPPPISSATASQSLDFLRSLDLSPTSGRISSLTLDNIKDNHVAPKESDVIENSDEHVDEQIDHGDGDSTGAPTLEINNSNDNIAASTATTTHDNEDRQQQHATTTTRPAADHDNNSNDNDSVDSWLRSDRPVEELANERAAAITEQIDREWDQLFENPYFTTSPTLSFI